MAVAIGREAKKRWTLAEVHSFPDDGNRYEVIDGDLYVTPAPAELHEIISARLTRMLDPFVERHALGFVLRPRAVFRYRGSEVEPDLMVRAAPGGRSTGWDKAPTPILIVEIVSPSTRRRDLEVKREFYLKSRIPEYWIVDPERREVTLVRAGEPDVVASDRFEWAPAGLSSTLTIRVPEIFGDLRV
jgi:Uma2 family endonuclease